MKNLKSTLFIIFGIYALLGIYFAKKLIFSYNFSPTGVQVLPINIFEYVLFALAFFIILISALTLYFFTKKTEFWKKNKTKLVISLIIAGVILFLLVANNLSELVTPSVLIFYGVIVLQINRKNNNNIFYFAIAEIALGIVSFLSTGFNWQALIIGFGIFPILLGFLERIKNKN